MKSTVRQRKGNPKAATQRFLPISEIRNDTVVLKNGGLRAVLEVQALNFNLKSETEQQGIIAGYQSFVNTLIFPIQVVVRSTKVNVDPYVEQIRKQAEEHRNPLLREQTLHYADFVQKIVEVADIMQKRFYVVVPLDDVQQKKSWISGFFSMLNLDDTAVRAAQRHRTFLEKAVKLKDRVTLVESGLSNIGLAVRRMNTMELIKLYYAIYNPKTSQEQKLGPDLNTAPMTL